ncbi:MAG: hypothetical protein HN337_04155 [Deltaproteobacteria bacterium]|jgi:sodium pump decarboxylase gamma subunit|nr:hypothetical protein [Deltaproteobacteria bacterium]
MLIDGLRIMAVGMGVVFLILLFLIVAVPISAKIIHAFEGPPSAEQHALGDAGSAKRKPIAAVIAAAIKKFRGNG